MNFTNNGHIADQQESSRRLDSEKRQRPERQIYRPPASRSASRKSEPLSAPSFSEFSDNNNEPSLNVRSQFNYHHRAHEDNEVFVANKPVSEDKSFGNKTKPRNRGGGRRSKPSPHNEMYYPEEQYNNRNYNSNVSYRNSSSSQNQPPRSMERKHSTNLFTKDTNYRPSQAPSAPKKEQPSAQNLVNNFEKITITKDQPKKDVTHLNGASHRSSEKPFQQQKPRLDENQNKSGIILLKSAPKEVPNQMKTASKSNNPSQSKVDSGKSSSSTPPKGGILRLDHESMKLLNQSIQNDSEQNQRNQEDTSRHGNAPYLDFDSALNLVGKLDYIARTSHHLDHTDEMVEPMRHKLSKFYEKVLLHDLNVARQRNALQMIWQYALYPFIDCYRVEFKKNPINVSNKAGLQDEPKAKHNYDLMISIITEGTKFFETLIHKMRSNYNFSYKTLIERRKHYDLNRSLFAHLQEITHNMKIIYIYLGDLSRYYQSVQAKPHFEKAKDYYMKAHMLVPKNSHACSQIAIICYYQKNHFDAIYYFVRSFESESSQQDSHVFTSSISPTPFSSLPGSSRNQHKQILTVIFDDIRHAYDETLCQLKAQHQAYLEKGNLAKKRVESGHSRINKNYRIEYWVRPSGTISKCDMYNFFDLAAVASEQEDISLLHFYRDHVLQSFSCRDLKKHFICSFLLVHGMLNGRSGLDRFYEVANQMLLEFDQLLNHSDSYAQESHSLSSVRLIQLLVINMYSISNTITDEDRVKNAAQYSFTHMNAYFVMSTMVIMILRRMNKLFEIFYRKHIQFMDEFTSTNRGGSHMMRQHSKSIDKDDHREVFEEETNIEDLFSFSKKNKRKDGSEPGLPDIESEFQEWKEFYQLLPCVKIWADWVISSKPRFPPQEMNDLKKSNDENIWQVFATFLTQFDKIKAFPVNFYCEDKGQLPLSLSPPKNISNVKYEYELVQLPEDRCLEGFKLILNAPESSKYIKLPFIPEISYTYMRIASIQLFGDYLCGLKNPYLRYNTKKSQYESQVNCDDVEGCPGLKLQTVQEEEFYQSLKQFLRVQQNLGISLDDEKGVTSDEEFEDDQEALEELNLLDISSSQRRKLLQYRKMNKRNRKYFKMIKHMNEPKQRFIIQPRYVIFDTNCFIDDLDSIKEFLVKSVPFRVTIPLIVIHELKNIVDRGQRISAKLADNSKAYPESEMDNIERQLALGKKCVEILDFLRDAFGSHHREVVCALSQKGAVLDNIDYIEEICDPNAVNNDDLILHSCEHLMKKAQGLPIKTMQKMLEDAGEKITDRDEFIHRNVILITNDLNLRLKSLCYEIPAKKLTQFLQWTRAMYREQSETESSLLPSLSPKP